MKEQIRKICTQLNDGQIAVSQATEQLLNIGAVSGGAFWNDDKVIDFVNWYIELHKLDFRYTLENRTIIESFKNGNYETTNNRTRP